MERRGVEIVGYDPGWVGEFARVAGRACAVLGELVERVEHVGSTAVVGLAGKDVVDVDVLLKEEAGLGEGVRRLAEVGYVHLGERGVHGRHFFEPPAGERRHHLSLCVPGSRGLAEHLAFRDVLREDAELARQYVELKRELAERFADDVDAYCEGKAAFIQGVLRGRK